MSVRVGDLTVDELRALLHDILRELVEEVVDERLGALVDPDEGLSFAPKSPSRCANTSFQTDAGRMQMKCSDLSA
jgi:hypothetical protein